MLQLDGTLQMHADASAMLSVPCASCETPLDVMRISAGAHSLLCHQCGHQHALQSIPLASSASQAAFAVGQGPMGGDLSVAQIAPITMSCPNCAAALRISRDNERITTCDFCNGEFLIPDPLWKRLHPVKTVTPWYVLFDQPPPPTAEELAQLRAQQEAEAQEQARKNAADERVRALEASIESLNQSIAREQRFFSASTAGGYVAALMGGIFLIGFPIIFVTPLAELVGGMLCDGHFSVSTNYSGGSTNYDYYCSHGDIRESFNVFALYAILIGIACMCLLWTLYIPVRRYKLQARIRPLEQERNQLEESLFVK